MKKRIIHKLLAQALCVMLVMGTLLHCTSREQTVRAMEVTKIMPLGDSITDCDFWRTMLFDKLNKNGYSVKSVGTRTGGHEGHSGMLVTDLAKTEKLVNWLDTSNPDIVMLLFGTNDCWCDKGTKAILDAYTVLVGQMRANNPNMIIVVGKVTPLIPNFTSDFVYRAADLAQAIDSWAKELSTKESPIYVTDQFTGFDAMEDTYDGVHPNSAGSMKMCEKWYETISSILDGKAPVVSEIPRVSEAPIVSEIPTVSEAPVVSEIPRVSEAPIVSEIPTVSEAPVTSEVPEVSEEPQQKLEVRTNSNSWGLGFTMAVKVENRTDKDVNGWKLIIPKKDFTITNAWCVEIVEDINAYVITPMSWNSCIQTGSTVDFGFQGTGDISEFSYELKN